MFDLILDRVDRPYRKRSSGATVTSVVGHVALIGCLIVLPMNTRSASVCALSADGPCHDGVRGGPRGPTASAAASAA